MTDLLGPADATNAVTARPADSRTFGGDDTWMKDCDGGVAGTGTKLEASFFNGILAQIRRAIRGMSIPVNNADDDMLLKAIKKAAQLEAAAIGGIPANVAVFQTPGVTNWTVPAGVTRVFVELWGGGGGGGGGQPNSFGASGGAGAGYASKVLTVTPLAVIPVTIGDGGEGGYSAQNGFAGGTTSFGAFFSAGGGVGGAYGSPAGPGLVQNNVSGIGSGGSVNLHGQRGGQGGGPADTWTSIGGHGGDCPKGGAGAYGTTAGADLGTIPGGGGAGAAGFGAFHAQGGKGGRGMCIVRWNDPPTA